MRWLFSRQPDRTPTYGDPDRYPVDTQKLARDLSVEEDAERLGKKDQPASDAKELTGTEAKIIQMIEKHRQSYLDWGNERLKFLNQDINALDLSPVARQIRQLDAEFERRASALLDGWVHGLRQLTTDIVEKEETHEKFRVVNRLNWAPDYPGGAERYFRYSVLLGLIVVEGILNSVFFAQGVWGGLLEGFFYAVLFAALNIGLAGAYGRMVFPQAVHANLGRKIAGIIAMPLCLAGVVAVALVIAHFRDAATTGGMAGAAQAALSQLRSEPFGLKDIYSWLLAGLSMVFAVAAIIDSYGLDDPYPGYGRSHRRVLDAKADYERDMETVRGVLSSLKEEVLAELDRMLDRLHVNLKRLDEAIAHKEAVERRLPTAFVDVDNCIDALIGKFRTTNRLHRTSPAPEYFAVRPSLRALTPTEFNVAVDRAKYQQQRTVLDAVISEVDGIRANIQASFSKQFDRLLPLDDQLTKGGKP